MTPGKPSAFWGFFSVLNNRLAWQNASPRMESMKCPLCQSQSDRIIGIGSDALRRDLYRCLHCFLVFIPPNQQLNLSLQKTRYDFHENTIENAGYVGFLNRAIKPALSWLKASGRGLDYGSGPGSESEGSVLARILEAKGFSMDSYDPIYRPDGIEIFPRVGGVGSFSRLEGGESGYDFIFSTEVWEHFTDPASSLQSIANLLKFNGILVVMTSPWSEKTAFESWHYAKDDTHVCFYHANTMEWIAQNWGWEIIERPLEAVWIFRRG